MKTELQKIRKAAGFRSAKAFAERMEMSVRTYTNYEQGVNKLSLEQAWAFADALGEAMGRFVPLDELAGREFPVSTSPPMSADERALVDAYRAVEEPARRRIARTAEGELEDMESAAKKEARSA